MRERFIKVGIVASARNDFRSGSFRVALDVFLGLRGETFAYGPSLEARFG